MKLGARVTFQPTGGAHLQVGVPSLLAVVLPREEEYRLYSREPRKVDRSELKIRLHKDYAKVWAEDNPPLRAAGFCRIWIPGFAALARPLYQALKGPDIKPLDWGLEEERAFQDIKKCIGCAPALGLPDPS